MHVTFLAHDGFLVELDSVCLLFDWWKGDLPPLPDKPLLVFASHGHKDHFKKEIFTLDPLHPDIQFLLGSDLRLSTKNLEAWELTPETALKCRRYGKHDVFQPIPGVTVETFPSTDHGVAWLVTADGKSVFHAGDLNWWHWQEEGEAWNRNMEANFKRYTEPLRGRKVDLAMLALDPRQESPGPLTEDWVWCGPRTLDPNQEHYGFWGAHYFLTLMEVRHFLPMHQWEFFEYTEEFLKVYPQFAPITTVLTRNGQCLDFS